LYPASLGSLDHRLRACGLTGRFSAHPPGVAPRQLRLHGDARRSSRSGLAGVHRRGSSESVQNSTPERGRAQCGTTLCDAARAALHLGSNRTSFNHAAKLWTADQTGALLSFWCLRAALSDAPIGQPASTVIQNANRFSDGRPVRGADERFRPAKGRRVVRCLTTPLANHFRNAPPEPNKLQDEDHPLALLGKHTRRGF
jgi:hypothetical protein